MIKLKRVYEDPKPADGPRFLVDRLWPRGIKKTALQFDSWIKDAAPSPELRKWFNHDLKKWDAFREKYFAELDRAPESLEPILQAARRGSATLLYGAKDPEHNNAVALKEYIERKLRR